MEPSDRYEHRGTLGRGGMGEVLRVFDRLLKREVALKRLRVTDPDDADLGRFLREAQVTSQLEHPNVPPVYDLGTDYFTMKALDGPTLVQLVEAGELTLHARLEILVKVCDAVAYAHARGVLHRDIKPSNVVVGGFGEVYLVDWGLAKPVDEVEASLPRAVTDQGDGEPLTGGGDRMGTPGFMSPEQTRGEHDDLDPRADIYALGVLLYTLLTGTRPFPDKGAQVVRKVLEGAFPRPREIAPGVPRELEAVVLKAMALRRDDRYASVDELSTDLRRWLRGEPVLAADYTVAQRLSKWAALRRGPLALGGLAGGIAGVLLVVTLWVNLTTVTRARDTALDASTMAQLALADSEVALAEARAALGRLDEAFEALERAEARYVEHDGPVARARLARSALAERFPPPDLTVGRRGAVLSHVALSDDGRRVLVHAEGVTRVLDVPMGRPLLVRPLVEKGDRTLAAAFVDDRPVLVVHRGERVFSVDLATGEPQGSAPLQGELGSGAAAFLSRDGRYLVVSDPTRGTFSLDLHRGGSAGPPLPLARIRALSADGARMVGHEQPQSAHRSAETLVVWDRATAEELLRFDRWAGNPVLSHDGRLLAWDEVDSLSLIEVDTGRVRWRIPQAQRAPRWAFAAGDTRLVGVGADDRVEVLDVTGGSLLGSRPIVGGPTASHGRVRVAASGDVAASWTPETLRVWSVETGSHALGWVASERNLTAVTATADGLLAVSAGWDGIVRVWEWRTRSLLREIPVCADGTRDVATSPDGRFVLTADRDGHARLVALATGEIRHTWTLAGAGMAMAAAFAPSGTAWVAFEGGQLGAWDPETGAEVAHVDKSAIDSVWSFGLSADGRLGWLSNRGRNEPLLEVWDLQAGELQWSAPSAGFAGYRGGFDQQAARLVLGTHEGVPHVWQLLEGVAVGAAETLPTRDEAIQAAAFDPTGTWLAVGGYDGQLDVYDAASLEPLESLQLHERSIVDMAWVPGADGVLITASGDAHLRVTDLRRWEKLQPTARFVDLDGEAEPDPDRWLAAARGSALRGNWARALAELELAAADGDPVPHLDRARALWALGRRDEARIELRASAEALPATVEAWLSAP